MYKVVFYLLCFCVLSGGFTACSNASTEKQQVVVQEKNLPKHVILVGFDGFSAYSLNNGADMPMLRKLMAEGASTVENRSVLPSSSAVNWSSMFMGAGPELHGYTEWGSRTPDLPSRVVNADNRFPNIFGLYREQHPDTEIGYIYEWEGLNYLVDTLAINYRQQAAFTEDNPECCTPFAVRYIKEKKPNFCAVLFDQPDGTGHKFGWKSQEYLDKMNELDGYLAQIVQAVEDAGMMDETVIVVVSDHGGIEKGHGGKTMDEMQTPIVFYGKGIKKGFSIPESTMIYDIAGTLAYLLDVEQPQVWIARPILSIFNP
ncbi:MAG: alkaline phosphatase [Tannerella sp.]|jgi:predicted AlkP superfamily pyrophosphatase or phosphodiesterase|nr:alkaline phosphatase [Tannerella sp.]